MKYEVLLLASEDAEDIISNIKTIEKSINGLLASIIEIRILNVSFYVMVYKNSKIHRKFVVVPTK